jgi:hypothetical protein
MGTLGTVVVASSGAFDVSTVAGAVTLALALAATIGMGALWRSTAPRRVRAAAATMELRDERPAVADLLAGGFEVEDDAVPATVVDLAARSWYTIEEIGGGRVVIRLRQRRPEGDTLTAFEERVLRHVTKHAVDGVTPAAVLTLGPEGVSQRWFTGFVREVTKHTRDLGLCHRRWDLRHLAMAWGLVAVALVPPALLGRGAPRTNDPTGWGTLGNLFLGLAFLLGLGLVWVAQRVSRSDAQVDTPAGLEAAAHWLGVRAFYREQGRFADAAAASVAIWDRHLAYATALGLAPRVQRELPFETEHDRHAWSLASGQWRRVKVRYQALVPSWGEHPGSVAFAGLVQSVVFGALTVLGFHAAGGDLDLDGLTDDQRRWIGLGGLVLAIVAAAATLFAALRLLLGLSDLFPRRTVEGELVRRRELATGHRLPKVLQWAIWSGRDELGRERDHGRRRHRYLAVDPGDVDRIVAYRVKPEIYRQVEQGARVRLRVSPRLGYVAGVEVLAPPRPAALGEPGAAHPLVAEAIDKVAGAVDQRIDAATGGRGIAGMLEQFESMTDEQGRPILDATDEDGVSARDHLARSRAELERLRSDPRVAGTPLLGQILDTLAGDGRPDDPRPADDPPHDGGPREQPGS